MLFLHCSSVALIDNGWPTSDLVINSICQTFSVNQEWLRTGEGEMYQAGPHDELSWLAKRYGLTAKQKILVERFLQLKPDTLEDIVRLIEKVAEDYSKDAGRVETIETQSTPPPVPLETKNPHEYTREEFLEAMGREWDLMKGDTPQDTGSGNSGTASA